MTTLTAPTPTKVENAAPGRDLSDLDTWLAYEADLHRGRPWLGACEAFDTRKVPSETLHGWCVQYRVRVYGYAGKPIPEPILRETLDMAAQHRCIYRRLWAETDGLGSTYGAPGRETFDSIRLERLTRRGGDDY